MPFKKSSLQALADRIHNDHPLPDQYRSHVATGENATGESRDPRLTKLYDDTIRNT